MSSYFVPTFDVKIEGVTLAADVAKAVIDLTYDNNLDTADMATIRLNNADLRLTDSALFDVGKQVEIYMGYVGDLHAMMLGEITAVNPVFPQGGAPSITITAYDKSHRMRHNTPERPAFKYVTDSVIAAAIAGENQLIPVVDPVPTSWRETVPQIGSDWAFLTELAERNFFEVFVRWDRLYFRFPRPQTELTTLEWGKNLSSFSPRLSTSGQAGIQVLRGYDYKLAQSIVAIVPAIELGGDISDIIERLGSDFQDQLMSLGSYVVRDKPVESYGDAEVIAKSILQQLLEGLYQGSGSCIGMPQLRAGDYVDINGVGRRFSKRYKLSKVSHTINDSGYQTNFEVSQNANSTLLQSLRKKLNDTPSPNKQDSIGGGLMVGKVVNNLDQEEGLGRVQVSFPSLWDSSPSAWARVVTPMAGEGCGAYFLPSVDDEVLVAFQNVDQPIVLGALWNGKRRPPTRNLGSNEKKMIKLKSGMQIVFDETSGKETLTISDKAGSSIVMSSPSGDITIEAKGNVTIKSGANGKIDLNP